MATSGRGRPAAALAQLGAAARAVPVVLAAVVVGVEELLEPLDELEVVLEAALHQLVHGHDLGQGRRRRRKVAGAKKRMMS